MIEVIEVFISFVQNITEGVDVWKEHKYMITHLK